MAEEIESRIAELAHPDARVRAAALIDLADREGVPLGPVHAALKDADLDVRACAAFALSKLGDEQSLPELVEAWQASRPEEVHLRRQLLLSLADIGDASALAQVAATFWQWPAPLQELILDHLAHDPSAAATELLDTLAAQPLSTEVRTAVAGVSAQRRTAT